MGEHFPEPKSSGERVKVEIVYLIMQQKQIWKIQQFSKKVDLTSLKSNKDNLDIDKLKNVLSDLSNLESKEDKKNVDKLVPVSVDFSKLIIVVKSYVVKKDLHNPKFRNI